MQEEEAAESAAQEAVGAELQRRAISRAAWLSATRRAAMDWLRSSVTEAASEAVDEWQRILQVGLPASFCGFSTEPAGLNSPGGGGSIHGEFCDCLELLTADLSEQ